MNETRWQTILAAMILGAMLIIVVVALNFGSDRYSGADAIRDNIETEVSFDAINARISDHFDKPGHSPLVAEISKIEARSAALELRIASLEARVAELEAIIAELRVAEE